MGIPLTSKRKGGTVFSSLLGFDGPEESFQGVDHLRQLEALTQYITWHWRQGPIL